ATLCTVGGCSQTIVGPGPGSGDAGTDGDVVTCQNDSRVDTYTPNLTKKSVLGAYQIVLAKSDPGPPAIGTNTWTIKVEDASGNPMPNPALRVLPFMPDHGHGTSVRAVI